MSKPKVLYIPTVSHTKIAFKEETYERFKKMFDVTENETGENYTTERLACEIKGYDGLMTGYGVPRLTGEVFENADKLRIIAHSAGSVKGFLSKDVVEKYLIPRGICVAGANQAIAYNVAEATLAFFIMVGRRLMDHALAVRTSGAWRDSGIPWINPTLNGSVVGIISASKVGREVIKLLKPFDLQILLYDPYLSDWEAGRMAVEKVELDEIFSRSDYITIHAPNIPETRGMVGERQLKLMKDGAVLVNTARGKLIDHDALYRECKTGRIRVALDVTDPEPLPADHPLRKLENVYITPHISGPGYYGFFKMGETALQALEDFFAEKPVRGAVNLKNYDILG